MQCFIICELLKWSVPCAMQVQANILQNVVALLAGTSEGSLSQDKKRHTLQVDRLYFSMSSQIQKQCF